MPTFLELRFVPSDQRAEDALPLVWCCRFDDGELEFGAFGQEERRPSASPDFIRDEGKELVRKWGLEVIPDGEIFFDHHSSRRLHRSTVARQHPCREGCLSSRLCFRAAL